MELTLATLLLLLPLGWLAGLLAGLLGIGGGLLFSPLLLALGLAPHQALATSTLAIVPTTLGGAWVHLRSGQLPLRSSLAIVLGAVAAALVCSHWGRGWASHGLLALQAAMYGLLAVVIGPGGPAGVPWRETPARLAAVAAVGLVAGAAAGLLGVGGGLLVVPLLARLLQLPVHLAIRLSTVAVLASSTAAAPVFLGDGRGLWPVALLLGGMAAAGARWSAARLSHVSAHQLVALLRGLVLLLALDSLRRAVAQALA